VEDQSAPIPEETTSELGRIISIVGRAQSRIDQATIFGAIKKLLRPCLGQGAFQGEEAVLAESGQAGEVNARVGWVRSLAFLSSLLKSSVLPLSCHSSPRLRDCSMIRRNL
jgi:hypothetical protein